MKVFLMGILVIMTLGKIEAACTCSNDGIMCEGTIENSDLDVSCRKLATKIIFGSGTTSSKCSLNLMTNVPNLQQITFEGDGTAICHCIVDQRTECDLIQGPKMYNRQSNAVTDLSAKSELSTVTELPTTTSFQSFSSMEVTKLELIVSGLRGEIDMRNRQIYQQAAQLSDCHQRFAEHRDKATTLSTDLADCNQRVTDHREKATVLDADLTECNQRVTAHRDKAAVLDADLTDCNQRVTAHRNKAAVLDADLRNQRGNMIERAAAMEQQHKNWRSDAIERIRQLESELQHVRDQLTAQNSTIERMQWNATGLQDGVVIEDVTLSINGSDVHCQYCCCSNEKSGGDGGYSSKIIYVLMVALCVVLQGF